jgi:dipeptidyl aminopeptidase/acylaminoacyl peptidase
MQADNILMQTIPIIPRKLLFGNPDKAAVQISPDGQHLAYLAPRDGVMNIWVAPRDDLAAARPITHDTHRGIPFYLWAHSNQHILYFQDKDGDENTRIYSVDIATTVARDLTPFESVQARPLKVSRLYPDEIVIALNNRRPEWHDPYRLNLASGSLTLLEQNDQFFNYVVDEHYRLVLACGSTSDGGQEIFKRTVDDSWETWAQIPPEDALTTQPIGLDQAGGVLFMKDSRGRDTSAVLAVNLAAPGSTLLAADPRADAQDVVVHPTQQHVQAVSFVAERKRWRVLDPAINPDLAYLAGVADGEMEIVSRSLDDQFWVVQFLVDDGPIRFYLYDRRLRHARFLFSDRAELEGQPLVKMHAATIQARDGQDLVVYYSLPPGSDLDGDGRPARPVPMVFMPHGGPWGRDVWGYSGWHQWLANRGYAVLAVNFRSSTGFGKAFTNAGDQQWGGLIMEDQVDAVRWSIAHGIADPQKVAVMGGSFGGYSTLAGLTLYPEIFACGVDVCGPVNLITLLETVPAYWKPIQELFLTRVGDYRTEAGRALLTKHSPLTYVDRIRSPLLIGQGANDPRVKQAEPEQIVAAMQARHIPVTYVVYPDEGHGFARPENNQSFNAIAEAFLAQILGGRCEPVGSNFQNSSLQVLTGAEGVPGLAEALGDLRPA